MNEHEPISVVLVDDHEVVREGLRSLFMRSGRLSVVGEARGVAEAIKVAAQIKPAVVVIDLRLPDGSGADAVAPIKQAVPGCKVLVLTSYADDALIMQAIGAGADGYLLKEIAAVNLVESILRVAEGSLVLDPLVARCLARNGTPVVEPVPESQKLSPLERHLVEFVAQGCGNKEIAQNLNLAESTVRNSLSRAFQKLGVSNRAEAVVWFVKQNQRWDRR